MCSDTDQALKLAKRPISVYLLVDSSFKGTYVGISVCTAYSVLYRYI